MITKNFIIDSVRFEYDKWLETESRGVIPLRDIEVKKMQPFGKVRNDGTLYINSSFIGTTLYSELLDTIRHELAHLIVGFADGHGNKWQACCRKIGCKPKPSTTIDDEIYIKNNYNYVLIAELFNGEKIEVRRYKRMVKKYLNVASGKYRVGGFLVDKFHYQEL